MEQSSRIQPGEKFGNLRIGKQIGSGAFASVYLATDELLQRPVALKAIRMRDSGGVSKSHNDGLAEARAVARFRHPNIVTLHRLHELSDGSLVFEMEYLGGGSVATRLREGWRPPFEQCLRIARDLASALAASHHANVIHGDIKPANILLAEDGRPKLADFGLSRVLHGDTDSVDGFRGTPNYMAPELLMGGRPIAESDIWSLGLTMYELTTGHYPFPTDRFPRLFRAVLNDPLAIPEIGMPRQLELFFRSALEKSARDRPSMAELQGLLEDAPPISQRPRSPAPPSPRRLVGRKSELREAAAFLDPDAQPPQLGALIMGEPGIGKSSLLMELRRLAQAKGIRCIPIQALPHRSLVAALLRRVQVELRETGADRGLASSKRILLDFLDSRTGALESQGQLLWAVKEALDALAAVAPVCLMVEDLHDSTEEDCRFLADLLERAPESSFSMLATSRTRGPPVMSSESDHPDLAHIVNRHRRLREITLAPLTAPEILRIVAEPHQTFESAVAHRVTQVAEGNPLIAKEFLRYLREVGGVKFTARTVSPGAVWDAHEIPRRIQSMTLARVDSLAEEDRSILDVAAIAGREFNPEVLAAVLEMPVLAVLRRLQSLYRITALIEPRGESFAFTHGVLHESIQQSLAPPLRRELHRLVAVQLEQRPGMDDEELGRHWILAGQQERAREYLVRAGDVAERRQQVHRAIELYQAAGVDDPDLSPEQVLANAESLIQLAVCYADRGKGEKTRRLFARLLEVAREHGDSQLERNVLLRSARLEFYARGPRELDVDAIRRTVADVEPGLTRAIGNYVLGLVAKARSELDRARDHFRDSYRDYRVAGRWSGASDALDQLGTVAKRTGRLHRAERFYRLAAATSARVGRTLNASVSEFNGALIRFQQGKLDGLSERLDACIGVLEIEGNPQLAAHARVIHAAVLRAMGEGDAARGSLESAAESLEGLEYVPGELALHTAWAEAHIDAGDLAAAMTSLEAARVKALAIGSAAPLAFIDALEAVAEAYRGETGKSMACFARALASPPQPVESSVADEVMFRIAQAVLLGVDARRWNTVRSLRHRVHAPWRAALIAARLLTTDRSSTARCAVVIHHLERDDISTHRAFLRGMSTALRSRMDGASDEERRTWRERSHDQLARLGARIFVEALSRTENIGPRQGGTTRTS